VLERPQKQTTAIATATRVEQATSTILFGLLMMHNQSVDRDNRGFKTGFRMPQKGGGGWFGEGKPVFVHVCRIRSVRKFA